MRAWGACGDSSILSSPTMFKKILILIWVTLFFLPAKTILAADYTIEKFKSQIEINQDTSITVTETIETNFKVAKHGIFRIIPIIYSAKGKTINGEFKLVSVNNKYSQSRQN